MFTLEIGGKPIAITDAEEEEARAIFESDDFKHDLMVLTSNGAPLWDGRTKLVVRSASDSEIAEFDTAETDPDLEDEEEFDDEEDGHFVTFLVPIDHDHDEP